jgi:hypothetical protein
MNIQIQQCHAAAPPEIDVAIGAGSKPFGAINNYRYEFVAAFNHY